MPRPDDTDLPGNLRFIEDDEWEKMPKHDKVEEPSEADKAEHAKQLKHEKEHGHPAHNVWVPDNE